MNKTLRTFSFLSIKDGKFKARYEAFTEATGDNRVITYENDAPVHPDLGEGMQRMTYHVVNLTGLMALDDDIHITGFQRQNCGDAQLLTIYARLEKDNMTCGNVAARFYIGRDEYPSIDLLLEDLSACEREALAYIEAGKRLEHDAFISLDDDDLETLNAAA
jgi:hypothetical protein